MGITPNPRASHTAVAYMDRFLIVIGGEGLPNKHYESNPLK